MAFVGLTERDAKAFGLNVRSADAEIGTVVGAQLHTEGYAGHAKLVIDQDKHVIVGATFVGPQVSELLHSATIAIVGQVAIDRLWHAVPSFPTVSEVWVQLLENYDRGISKEHLSIAENDISFFLYCLIDFKAWQS